MLSERPYLSDVAHRRDFTRAAAFMVALAHAADADVDYRRWLRRALELLATHGIGVRA